MADSFIKACQRYFSAPPFARKVEIPEFKALSTQDKVELSKMLQTVPGYEHDPYMGEQGKV
jgi:hypothetical protein